MRLGARGPWILTGTLCMALSACGNSGGTAANHGDVVPVGGAAYQSDDQNVGLAEGQTSLFDLFLNDDDPNTTLEVNRYIWTAAMEVLDFMPIESADPFSGVIVMGYGTPPGGSRAYRATVYVQDPSLDARALNVALATSSGPASAEATRSVEDAILTRARQLRIRDQNL
jgi:hypothetical protein